eukprot:SAG31_NODE_1120_length_9805_cov_8.220173_1_plen_47_part_00
MFGECHIRRTFGEHSALFGGGLDERPFLGSLARVFTRISVDLVEDA